MKPTEICTGQKVTIFRRLPNQHLCINDKVGRIGTIMELRCIPETDDYFARVRLEGVFIYWFPTQMLELTPTPDQAKIGARIQVAESNRYLKLDYAGAYGTIIKPIYGVDNNIEMLPDDPALRAKWGTITLSGLNRFRILEQAPNESCKFRDVCGRLEIQPSQYESISYTLHLDGDITPSELRDKLNKFIDKMEECIQ